MTKDFLGNEDYVDVLEAQSWQKDIFNQIKPGTILYCEMPLCHEKLMHIPNGHRTRPYVIVKKGEKNVYGYACATHPHPSLKYDQLFRLENFAYQRDIQNYVDSFIQLDKPFRIPISNILDLFDELNEKTMFELELQIRALEKRRNIRLMRFNLLMRENKMDIAQIGDVILYKNQYYFVYEIKKKKYFILMPIVRQHSKSMMYYDMTEYLEKGKSYGLNMNEDANVTFQICDSNKIQIVKRCTGNIVQCVQKAMRDYKKGLKNQKAVQKSSSFSFGDVLKSKLDHSQYVFIVSYHNVDYALPMEDYECDIAHVKKIKPVMMECVNNLLSNKKVVNYSCLKTCLFQLKKELGNDFFECENVRQVFYRLGIKNKQMFKNLHQKFPVGTIVSQSYSDSEYIYLFTYKKSTYMLDMEDALDGMTNPINVKFTDFEAMDELTDETVYDLLKDLKESTLVRHNEEIQAYVDQCMQELMERVQTQQN